MRIAIIGTGYVGLVTGVCFAATMADPKNPVICIDNNPEKLKKLKKGDNPIYEPGLDELLKECNDNGYVEFTDDLEYATKEADVIFLCLPTPPKEDGSADLQYVLQVAEDMSEHINSFKVIVNKSTVPVGTGDLVEETIKEKAEADFAIVSNPEFLKEGAAVMDFLKPDRVVIGSSSQRALDIMTDLYSPFTDQIITMDIRSSEMTKYAANSFLATKISFINEIANLCDEVGSNVDNIARGIGADHRIGPKFLKAGIGYGGSCFPKDVSALHKTGKQYNYHLDILDSVMKVNKKQKEIFLKKVVNYFDNDLKGKKIAIWGLSFKPETDDVREAPATEIITQLQEKGAEVIGFDPVAMENFAKYSGTKIKYAKDKYHATKNADALLILTEWTEFQTADLEAIQNLMKEPAVFDGRNIFDHSDMEKLGFKYQSMGR